MTRSCLKSRRSFVSSTNLRSGFTKFKALSIVALAALGTTRPSQAAVDNWIQTTGGNWETAANWSLNATPVGGSSDAYFNTGSASPYTVTLPGTEISNSVHVIGDSVTFDSTNNSNESLESNSGLYVLANAGQTSSATLVGNGGYGMENNNLGTNVGGGGTAYLTLHGVRLTDDNGFNFAAGSIVSVDSSSSLRGSTLNIGGVANISGGTSLTSDVNVGGPGTGAVLNGGVTAGFGNVYIGSGGPGTVNGGITANLNISIGVHGPSGPAGSGAGILNGSGNAEEFNIGTSSAPGTMNASGTSVALLLFTVGAQGTVDLASGGSISSAFMNLSGGVINDNGNISTNTLTILTGSTLGINPEHGSVNFKNSLSLNGTLNVTLDSGYIPSAGQVFDLFNDTSGPFTETGTFSAVNLPALPNGLTWNTQSLYTNGSISVVPEPAALGLLLGLGLISGRPSRRRT